MMVAVIVGLFVSSRIAFVVFMTVVYVVLTGVALLLVRHRRRGMAAIQFTDAVVHPGWHPDPVLPGAVRFFDGQAWTSFTAHRRERHR